ncbi:hypothetical protein AYO38_08785 [bacterium SCGC AG-212-C10]|nr:hypothetical protein AYO38_08785 [bacterium SCGC AG-212-C10]
MFSIYVDDDAMRRTLVRLLRAAGVDVLTTAEAGQLGMKDPRQLRFATGIGRAIYTTNRGDFAKLHGQFLADGEPHAGIIICSRQDIPPNVQARRIIALQREWTTESIRNTILYISRES